MTFLQGFTPIHDPRAGIPRHEGCVAGRQYTSPSHAIHSGLTRLLWAGSISRRLSALPGVRTAGYNRLVLGGPMPDRRLIRMRDALRRASLDALVLNPGPT